MVKTMAASFLLLKIGPAILSPVLLLAKSFMQVQKALPGLICRDELDVTHQAD